MKKLFVFVLLCNLVLAGVLALLSGEDNRHAASAPPPLPASAARLKLSGEVPAVPAVVAAAEPTPAAEKPVASPAPAVPAVEPPSAGAPPASAPSPAPEAAGKVAPPPPAPVAAPPAPATPAAAAPPPKPDLCRSFGPFANKDAADQVGRELAKAGFDVDPRQANQPELFGYWVYLPPFPSRAAAVEAAQHLVDLGIRDYFIVLTSGKRNAISLGVFSQKSSAERRKERMQALGFSPVVEERTRDHTVYWLDYRGKTEVPESVWKPLAEQNAGMQRVARDCP